MPQIRLSQLGASIVMKYYYTTVVGVDYMLSQILSSRRYEVYMQMASEDNMWSRPVYLQVGFSASHER